MEPSKTKSQHYILLGNPRNRKSDAEVIISEMKASCPEFFDGAVDSFPFELRYVAPFDKAFLELKRLQGTAALNAGRRNEFRGYIIIDLSQWLMHHDEEYFTKALLFLLDMSECWKYVFLLDNQNAKAAQKLVSKVLCAFFQDHIPCEVMTKNDIVFDRNRITVLCKEQEVMCSASAMELLREVLNQGFGENIVSALLFEVSRKFGRRIGARAIAECSLDCESVIHYMLNPAEYDRLNALIEKRKEVWNGEKEAV